VVNLSSGPNQAVRYTKDGRQVFEWRDWKTFFSGHYRPLRGIRDYQQFRFSSASPGVVFVKSAEDTEELSFTLTSADQVPWERPDAMPAAGLSHERQTYLARMVRPYLREHNKDRTCPEE